MDLKKRHMVLNLPRSRARIAEKCGVGDGKLEGISKGQESFGIRSTNFKLQTSLGSKAEPRTFMDSFVAPTTKALLNSRSVEREINDFQQQATSGEVRIDLGTLLVTRRDGLYRNRSLVIAQTSMDSGRWLVVNRIPLPRFCRQIPTLFESRPHNPRPAAGTVTAGNQRVMRTLSMGRN
jgi:hypothetical protein